MGHNCTYHKRLSCFRITCSTKCVRSDARGHVHLAEPEVDEPDVALRVEHDVLGLEVAVDDVA